MKLAVLADFAEENWPSMDLFADELVVRAARMPGIEVTRVQPRLLAPATRIFGTKPKRWVENAERASGRYVEYPVRTLVERGRFDRFHFVDHSYAHLVLLVPKGRAGVYCHDIDAIRPLLESRPSELWRRAIARGVLAGLRRASAVFYSTQAVRNELETHGLVDPERLVHAPPGVAAEFCSAPGREDEALRGRSAYVLHVGSLIPRKNPEFLLRAVAGALRVESAVEFVQVGGEWSESMLSLARELGISERIRRLRALSRDELAALYRNARVVVLPSLAEGFGLPIIEALSCGAPVIASDLPVLRQVGAEAVTYVALGDLETWSETLRAALTHGIGPPRETRLRVAARYSWEAHADTIVRTHERLNLARST